MDHEWCVSAPDTEDEELRPFVRTFVANEWTAPARAPAPPTAARRPARTAPRCGARRRGAGRPAARRTRSTSARRLARARHPPPR